MADRPASPLSQSWLDTQACLCPAGLLIYAGSVHDQRLDSKPLAKHSRFFGYKDFLKGLGALPGTDIFCLCPTCSLSVSDFYIFPKYFPSVLGGRPVPPPGMAGSLGSILADPLHRLACGVSSHHRLSFPGVLGAEGPRVEWGFLFCF